jgi:putative alpha-1,2-mannosidase
LERNWVRHEEIAQGAHLEIITSTEPNKQWGTENQWISSYE